MREMTERDRKGLLKRHLASPIRVMAPMGPRKDQFDPDGRTEIEVRGQDWPFNEAAICALEMGVGYGVQVQAPEKMVEQGINPRDAVGDLPMMVHLPNQMATKAHAKWGDANYRTENEKMLRTMASWGADGYVLHGPGFASVPSEITPQRYNLRVRPADWLVLGLWTRDQCIPWLQSLGLAVDLEWVYTTNYILYTAADGTSNWLPITTGEPRVGVFRDVLNISRSCRCGTLVDFEHLESCIKFAMGDSLELSEQEDLRFAEVGDHPIFEDFYGLAAEEGRITRAVKPTTWEQIVSEAKTAHYHIGGIQRQVVPLEPEHAGNSYYEALRRQLAGNEYALSLALKRRGGSHGPIELDDGRFREMMAHVLSLAEDNPEPLNLVIEVSNYRDGKKDGEDDGYWWWSPKDSLSMSLENTRTILGEMLGE